MHRLAQNKRSSTVLWIVYVCVIATTYLPLITMAVSSFASNRYLTIPLQGATLQWYQRIFNDGQFTEGFFNSILIATLVAATATLIGFMCAYSLVNARFPGKYLITLFVLAPLAVPLLLVGISLRLYFTKLSIQPSLVLVYLGQVVYVLPLAILNLRNRLAQIPRSHEEAAWALGASNIRAIWDVVVPACRLSLIATLILTFTFAFDEFVIAYFLTNFSTTLPIKIWTSLVTGFDPTINALGTLVFLFSMSLGVIAQLLFMRKDVR